MQLKIILDDRISEYLKSEYAHYVYSSMKKDLQKLVSRNTKKYKLRESLILKCPLIKWRGTPPKTINLTYYVSNCLVLVKRKGEYIIQLNDNLKVKGSFTKVKTLVRILEYGTSTVPYLPVVRTIFLIYRMKYKQLFVEFMKERLGI